MCKYVIKIYMHGLERENSALRADSKGDSLDPVILITDIPDH